VNEQKPLNGKCLCGSVKIIANKVNPELTACHCSMCRQWGGGPYMEVSCKEVIIKDIKSVSVFNSSDWAERGFCKKCGTHLFYHIKESDEYQIQVGLFGSSINPKFKCQVFIDKKPAYYTFVEETQNLTEAQIFEMYAPKEK
jgi:hypothetical protein